MKILPLRFISLLAFLILLFSETSSGQNADRQSVINVARAYIEAMYESDAGKMEKILHADVIKKGYYWKGKDQQFSEMTSITKLQIIQITRDWNKGEWLPESAPKDISMLDIQDQIASVKVTAYWGIDYLHISRIRGEWLIIQILSQNWSKKDLSGSEE